MKTPGYPLTAFDLLVLSQVRELLSQKLSSWQQSCSQPTKLPERALNLLRHTAPQSSGAAGIAEVLRHTKIGSAQPEQVRALLFKALVWILEQLWLVSAGGCTGRETLSKAHWIHSDIHRGGWAHNYLLLPAELRQSVSSSESNPKSLKF